MYCSMTCWCYCKTCTVGICYCSFFWDCRSRYQLIMELLVITILITVTLVYEYGVGAISVYLNVQHCTVYVRIILYKHVWEKYLIWFHFLHRKFFTMTDLHSFLRWTDCTMQFWCTGSHVYNSKTFRRSSFFERFR